MIEIIPAIDIIGGKCTRLSQGDYATQKNYGGDPAEWARAYADCGVRRLHLVDLEGAKEAAPRNLRTLEAIASLGLLKVEWGGGIKDDDALASVWNAGADWAIIGSIAAKEPELMLGWLRTYGSRIILGADVRDGKVAVSGWLEDSGIEDMQPVVTSKHTYIAPYANAEEPQYLVVEDAFPNGRPPLEEAGVYMTDRETVNKAERMKVTVCLNPIHTALCTYDCMLGYELFADGMKDPEIAELARQVGYVEGLPVVEDPGILSPKAFLDELMSVRFPNPYLGDTSARIATDVSQMTAIRFGETVKAYVARDGDAKKLVAIPLAVAGWIRYLKDTTLTVTTEKQTFTYEFAMNDKSDNNGRLEFNLGHRGSTATVYIQNVRVEEIG